MSNCTLASKESFSWFCFLGDFWSFFGLTKVPFGDYLLFFLGFLSKSKFLGHLLLGVHGTRAGSGCLYMVGSFLLACCLTGRLASGE